MRKLRPFFTHNKTAWMHQYQKEIIKSIRFRILCKKMLCFLEEKKHSWQKKFTTTSHGGHDKFELCLNFYLMLDSRQVWCLRCWGPRRQTSGVGGWDRQEHKSSSETFPSGSSPTPCLWCSCKKGVFLLTSEKASPPSARASSMKAATSGKCREMFCWGTSSSFSPLYLMSNGE